MPRSSPEPGFLPVLALYFCKLSGGLMFPCQTNTGLLSVKGSDQAPKLVERSGPIAHA